MNISSMTGFSHQDDVFENENLKFSFVWEIKSVNAKGLDVKVKLPSGFDEIESEVKNLIAQNFSRGTFNLLLTINNESKQTDISIDINLLEVFKNEASKLYFENENIFTKLSATDLLKMPGVIKANDNLWSEENKILLHRALFESLEKAIQKLQSDRKSEGEKIGLALLDILDKIEERRVLAEKISAGMQMQIKNKISEQIKEFVIDSNISPERLEQEVLFYVLKADVREELERLKAHVLTAREIFEKGGNIGRRLDFLCQELNREANTLCSKSMDLEQTKIGMDLKALIEQFREQIQNME